MAFNLNGFNFNQSVVDSQGRVINTWASAVINLRESPPLSRFQWLISMFLLKFLKVKLETLTSFFSVMGISLTPASYPDPA
jgi:hypothetical protein